MDFVSNADVYVSILMIEQGEPFVPDVGSVTYTLLDHAGEPVVGMTNVAVTTNTATIKIDLTIPAIRNEISGSKSFEKRTVSVNCLRNGRPLVFMNPYRLTPRLNHTVTAAKVRSFIGLQEKELGDKEIDLSAAYFKVEKDIGKVAFEAALASGTTQELAANELIEMQAVLAVLPSVKQRIAQEEKNGPLGFSRPTVRDFKDIAKLANERYSAAKQEVLNSSETAVTLVLTTQDADPITG